MKTQSLPAPAAIKSKIGNRKSKISPLLSTASAALLLLSACTTTSYTSPAGEHFSRTSFGANTSLHSLAFDASTNGLRRVEVRGYANNNTEALGTVTEAAVRAAISSAK